MSTVTFDLPAKIKVRDKITGFTGTITARIQRINGCLQYLVKPRVKDGENKLEEGIWLDFPDIEVLDDIVPMPQTVTFKFETGDRVRSRVTGKEGIVTTRKYDSNDCICYWHENGEQNKKGDIIQFYSFEQELELIDKGLNKPEEAPVARRNTGCDHAKAPPKG
jgi:hypothetical protein